MIDYREFYELLLAATTGGGKKTFFERQRDSEIQNWWLETSYSSKDRREGDDQSRALRLTNDVSFSLQQQLTDDKPLAFTKVFQNTRPLGDLRVLGIQLHPPQLMDGEWPSSYTLSDHGIMEVEFEVFNLFSSFLPSFPSLFLSISRISLSSEVYLFKN